MSDPMQKPITIGDFGVLMNTVLIEVYADLSPSSEIASEKLTDLATRLHNIALQVTDEDRRNAIMGLSITLMHTEDGG